MANESVRRMLETPVETTGVPEHVLADAEISADSTVGDLLRYDSEQDSASKQALLVLLDILRDVQRGQFEPEKTKAFLQTYQQVAKSLDVEIDEIDIDEGLEKITSDEAKVLRRKLLARKLILTKYVQVVENEISKEKSAAVSGETSPTPAEGEVKVSSGPAGPKAEDAAGSPEPTSTPDKISPEAKPKRTRTKKIPPEMPPVVLERTPLDDLLDEITADTFDARSNDEKEKMLSDAIRIANIEIAIHLKKAMREPLSPQEERRLEKLGPMAEWLKKRVEEIRSESRTVEEVAVTPGTTEESAEASAMPEAERMDQEVDPTNLWTTYVRKHFPEALNSPESDGKSIEEQEKILRLILEMCVEYAATYLWEEPLDKDQVENEANFKFIPIRTATQKLTFNDLFNNIPDEKLQKDFKERMDFLFQVLKRGAEWSTVIAKGGSFEAFGEYLRTSLYDGTQWQILQKLPSLNKRDAVSEADPAGAPATPEPGFGHQIFYGLNYYTNWNQRYVYANDAEFGAMSDRFEELLHTPNPRTGEMELKIPSPADLKQIIEISDIERLKEQWAAILPKWMFSVDQVATPSVGAGGEIKITLGDLRQLLLESGPESLDPAGLPDVRKPDVRKQSLYDNFVRRFKAFVVQKMVAKSIESSNQTKYGMFPLVEFGNVNPEKKHQFREEIAIAIGCYTLGLGEYVPNIRPDETHAGELLDAHSGAWRPLSMGDDSERERALKIGKAPELFAFDAYIASCNHWFDDDVTMKANLTANRACITEAYRSQYLNSRGTLDGLYRYGVRFLTSLFPRPLSYLSTNGVRLKEVFSHPDLYDSVDLTLIGDRNSKFVKLLFDTWGYVVDMYRPLSVGISSKIGANVLDLAKVTQPKTIFSSARELEFNHKAIDELTTFYAKVISYWVDRLTASEVSEIADPNSPKFGADKAYWTPLVSPIDSTVQTSVCTPLMNMLNFTPIEQHELALLVKKAGNGAGEVKAREAAEKRAFNNWVSKTLLLISIVEDMMRSNKKTIDNDDMAVLNYVLTTDPTYIKWVKRRYNLKGAGPFDTNTADTISFSSADVARMVIDSGMRPQGTLSSILKEAGGLPGA